MCGRFYVLEDENQIRMVFPTDTVSVLTADGWREMRWGIPHWSGRGVHINARAETAAQKVTFRDALRQRRCLVPASGYYEWKRADGQKTKDRFRLFRADDRPLMMAGIYTPEGAFAILTQPPNETVAALHDRMPVLLPTPEHEALWLHQPSLAELLLSALPDVPLRDAPETPDPPDDGQISFFE